MNARDRYATLKKNMENQLLVITLGELREKIEQLQDDHLKNFIKIWYSKYPVDDPLASMNQIEILESIDLVDRTLKQYGQKENAVTKALEEVKESLEEINGAVPYMKESLGGYQY
jgi:hypothetical protein